MASHNSLEIIPKGVAIGFKGDSFWMKLLQRQN
jgi:hypothetical protein